mgnify:CR=1 FL=1
MKLVAGLGNVGANYSFTRHNAGFMVLDKWALIQGVSFSENKKLKCYLSKFKLNSEDIILIKPTTFMNLSGEAVRAVVDYYKIDINDVLIVYDVQCFAAVISFKKGIISVRQIYFQCIDDVFLIVTDQDVRHLFSPFRLMI